MIWLALVLAQVSFNDATNTVVAKGGTALEVYFGDSKLPMLGDVVAQGDTLRFRPRFRFLPDRDYRAVLRLSSGEVTTSVFHTAAAAKIVPHVMAIYPSPDILPANLLRFYVQFSEAMPDMSGRIRLVHETGATVEHAFLETENELWDRDRRRLTVFLDPGRIKRGVGLNESMGLALKQGQHYQLVVSLQTEFVKEFRVGPEDRTSPDVARWRIARPAAGTLSPLIVDAEKPLDRALFERLVRVEDAAGRPISGSVAVESNESRWRFVPDEPWCDAEYRLRVAGELEDLAGNRPTRLFEEAASTDEKRNESRDVVIAWRTHS